MFDIGWSEMAVIALLALIVLGPKDLPKAMQTVAHWVRKARAIAREFQSGIDDMMREAELDEAKKTIESARNLDVRRQIEDNFDPTGEVSEEARDLERTARSDEAEDGASASSKSGSGTGSTKDGKEAEADAPRAEIRKSPLQMAPGNSVKPPPENGEDRQPATAEAASANGASEAAAKPESGAKADSAKKGGQKSGSGPSAARKKSSGKTGSPKTGSPKKSSAKSGGKTASAKRTGSKAGAGTAGGKGNA